jgi:hypothetical protein
MTGRCFAGLTTVVLYRFQRNVPKEILEFGSELIAWPFFGGRPVSLAHFCVLVFAEIV